jgi:hypothetical protein
MVASKRKGLTAKQAGIKHGYRSGLEDTIAKQLELMKIPYKYEERVVSYTVPESKHKYTPDFELPNGIIIETKGRFLVSDRKKHLLVKEQHPELDIRFVFSNPRAKISKVSKTTYADWCDKYGFKYADKMIPDEWIKEPKK